jgi:hypothetical protein
MLTIVKEPHIPGLGEYAVQNEQGAKVFGPNTLGACRRYIERKELIWQDCKTQLEANAIEEDLIFFDGTLREIADILDNASGDPGSPENRDAARKLLQAAWDLWATRKVSHG